MRTELRILTKRTTIIINKCYLFYSILVILGFRLVLLNNSTNLQKEIDNYFSLTFIQFSLSKGPFKPAIFCSNQCNILNANPVNSVEFTHLPLNPFI